MSLEDKSVTALRALLNNVLRISITDGRIFLGSFLGTDQALNLLLLDTEEFRVINHHSKDSTISNWDGRLLEGMDMESPSGRYVGQVLIPWKQIVKVEAHGKMNDQEDYRRRLYL